MKKLWDYDWIYEYTFTWSGAWQGKLQEYIESKGHQVVNSGPGWVQTSDGTKYYNNFTKESK